MQNRFSNICFSIFIVFIFFFTLSSTADAKTRIAIIIKSNTINLSPELQQELSENMNNLFPPAQYQLIKNQNLNNEFDSFIANRVIHDPTDTKPELLELCKKYKYDCILLLYYHFDTSSSNNNLIKLKGKTMLTLKGRMVFAKTNSYIYNSDITRVGVSTVTFSNINQATYDSISKCNEQLFSILELPLAKRTIELS